MSVTVVVPWPRYPTTTPGGKPSKAKDAGKLMPWLSMNVVRRMQNGHYYAVAGAWRDKAQAAVKTSLWPSAFVDPVEVSIRLWRATSHEMDPFAVAEGAKSLVDGLEAAGLILDDKLAHPGHMEALKAATRAECRVEIELRAVGGVV